MISIHIKLTVCLFVCLLKPVSGFVGLEIISIYSNHHIWGLRERVKKKKKVEFSTKVGGWGQQWTHFPLLFFFLKKI